tara:strand:+ start:1463 stop:1684 length:222 start_codon:yes stop_codon:yes gene_type:complete
MNEQEFRNKYENVASVIRKSSKEIILDYCDLAIYVAQLHIKLRDQRAKVNYLQNQINKQEQKIAQLEVYGSSK